MKRAMITDVYPTVENGNLVYKEINGLGATQSFVNTATNITNITAAAAAAVPTQPVTVQSDFSKGANVVATGAATVAAIAAVVPGIGTVVAVVAGVVAAAAALLGKIFANSKAKAYAAERGEYEKVNAQIKFENQQLDQQYIVTNQAIEDLKSAISSLSGIPHEPGLGICWWDCKDEKKALNSAKAEFEVLTREQENKTKILASLLDEYNKLVKGILELKTDKSAKDWLLYVLIAAAAIGAAYYWKKK